MRKPALTTFPTLKVSLLGRRLISLDITLIQ